MDGQSQLMDWSAGLSAGDRAICNDSFMALFFETITRRNNSELYHQLLTCYP